jgi:type IV pilus assembly protein PilE
MKRQFGMTFIELLVVLTIISILAAIAVPAYRDYVRRSDRATAKSALLENAQFMERNFTTANRYDKDSAGNDIDASKLPVPTAPKGDGKVKYNIELGDNLDETSFTLKAVPAGAMVGDPCGTLTLDHTGRKGVEGATKDAEFCWNK